jgi:ABC-type uncharacterized transport system fused permease/ATPase subunit
VFVDKGTSKFASVLVETSLLTVAVCVSITVSYLVGQLLIIQWRQRLTSALHTHYFHHDTFYQLSTLKTCPYPEAHAQSPAPPFTETGPNDYMPHLLYPHALASPRDPKQLHPFLSSRDINLLHPQPLPSPHEPLPHVSHGPDNPDQRMTDDVNLFCTCLEQCFQKSAKSPFNLALYSYFTYTVFQSAKPILIAIAYFCVCAVLHRLVISALATAIYAQQHAEGNFRSVHVRVRNNAESIAAWGGAGVEERWANRSLLVTLMSQLRLAWAYTAQQLVAQVCGLHILHMHAPRCPGCVPRHVISTCVSVSCINE